MTNRVEVFATPVPPVVIESTGVTTAQLCIDPPDTPHVVELTVPGPQGPPGTAYMHHQLTSSSTWTMSHNLGFRPSVELLNSGGQEVEGDILHLSENVCVAYFNQPIAGLARLN